MSRLDDFATDDPDYRSDFNEALASALADQAGHLPSSWWAGTTRGFRRYWRDMARDIQVEVEFFLPLHLRSAS